MNKTRIVAITILAVFMVSLLTYLNYDKIVNYLTNREWEIADSVGKIELEKYVDAFGTNSNFFVINNGTLYGYSDNSKKNIEESLPVKESISDTAGDFAIIGEKNSTNVYVINKNEIVWSTNINNANILKVDINKNGYSCVVYSQAGYKSLIKVFSYKGDELFTSYLASTYAVDAVISNDNKTLALAEIDTNGVSLASKIKLIDMQSASENDIKKYDLENDEMVCNIEYDNSNQLVIMTDTSVKVLKNNELRNVVNFEEDKIFIADINNNRNIVTAKVEEKGLFNSKCYIYIYSLSDDSSTKTFEIEETPNKIVTLEDTIAVDTGNKIIFLNSSGNFLKKCEYKGQLKDIKLFNNGNTAVLLFRDTAEFIKIGGI